MRRRRQRRPWEDTVYHAEISEGVHFDGQAQMPFQGQSELEYKGPRLRCVYNPNFVNAIEYEIGDTAKKVRRSLPIPRKYHTVVSRNAMTSSSQTPRYVGFLELLLSLYEPIDVSDEAHDRIARRLSALHRRFGAKNGSVLSSFERLVIEVSALAKKELVDGDDPQRCFDLLALCNEWTRGHGVSLAFPGQMAALQLLVLNTTAFVYARAKKFEKALGSLGTASAIATAAHTSTTTSIGTTDRMATSFVEEVTDEEIDNEEEGEGWIPFAVMTKLATCHLLLTSTAVAGDGFSHLDNVVDDEETSNISNMILQRTLSLAETAVYDAQELIERQRWIAGRRPKDQCSSAGGGPCQRFKDPYSDFLCFGAADMRHGALLALAYYQLANILRARGNLKLSEDWFQKAAGQIEELRRWATETEECLEEYALREIELKLGNIPHRNEIGSAFLAEELERWETENPELRGARSAVKILVGISRLVRRELQLYRQEPQSTRFRKKVDKTSSLELRTDCGMGSNYIQTSNVSSVDGLRSSYSEGNLKANIDTNHIGSANIGLQASTLPKASILQHPNSTTDDQQQYRVLQEEHRRNIIEASASSKGGVIFLGGPSAFERSEPFENNLQQTQSPNVLDTFEEEERKKSHSERVISYRQKKDLEQQSWKLQQQQQQQQQRQQRERPLQRNEEREYEGEMRNDGWNRIQLDKSVKDDVYLMSNEHLNPPGNLVTVGEKVRRIKSSSSTKTSIRHKSTEELQTAVKQASAAVNSAVKSAAAAAAAKKTAVAAAIQSHHTASALTIKNTIDVENSLRISDSPTVNNTLDASKVDHVTMKTGVDQIKMASPSKNTEEIVIVTIQSLIRGVRDRKRVNETRERQRHSSAVQRMRQRRKKELMAAQRLQLWARSIAARWQMRQKTKSRVLAAAIAAKRQNQIAAVIVIQKYERRRQKQRGYFELLAVLKKCETPMTKTMFSSVLALQSLGTTRDQAPASAAYDRTEDIIVCKTHDHLSPTSAWEWGSPQMSRKDTSANGVLATAVTETRQPGTPYPRYSKYSEDGDSTNKPLEALIECDSPQMSRKDTSANGVLATAVTETRQPGTPYPRYSKYSDEGDSTNKPLEALVEHEDEGEDDIYLLRTMSQQFTYTGGVYLFSPDGAGALPPASLEEFGSVASSDGSDSSFKDLEIVASADTITIADDVSVTKVASVPSQSQRTASFPPSETVQRELPQRQPDTLIKDGDSLREVEVGVSALRKNIIAIPTTEKGSDESTKDLYVAKREAMTQQIDDDDDDNCKYSVICTVSEKRGGQSKIPPTTEEVDVEDADNRTNAKCILHEEDNECDALAPLSEPSFISGSGSTDIEDGERSGQSFGINASDDRDEGVISEVRGQHQYSTKNTSKGEQPDGLIKELNSEKETDELSYPSYVSELGGTDGDDELSLPSYIHESKEEIEFSTADGVTGSDETFSPEVLPTDNSEEKKTVLPLSSLRQKQEEKELGGTDGDDELSLPSYIHESKEEIEFSTADGVTGSDETFSPEVLPTDNSEEKKTVLPLSSLRQKQEEEKEEEAGGGGGGEEEEEEEEEDGSQEQYNFEVDEENDKSLSEPSFIVSEADEISLPSYLGSSEGSSDFQVALRAHANDLGVQALDDSSLEVLNLVKESLRAPLPIGWSTSFEGGSPFFINEYTGEHLKEHPLDNYYRRQIKKVTC